MFGHPPILISDHIDHKSSMAILTLFLPICLLFQGSGALASSMAMLIPFSNKHLCSRTWLDDCASGNLDQVLLCRFTTRKSCRIWIWLCGTDPFGEMSPSWGNGATEIPSDFLDKAIRDISAGSWWLEGSTYHLRMERWLHVHVERERDTHQKKNSWRKTHNTHANFLLLATCGLLLSPTWVWVHLDMKQWLLTKLVLQSSFKSFLGDMYIKFHEVQQNVTDKT